MQSPRPKTRFAPSPTGYLHLGNARTALFNLLLAHRLGGSFLLRIEDTDPERSAEPFVAALMEDLRWLGLAWEEGPAADAGSGPYRQSERSEVYAHYFAALEAPGAAYPCFCTERELALARKAQRSAGRPPRYPGTCARLTPEEVGARRERGLPAALRFRVPRGRVVRFDDLVRGAQDFASDELGDFIIRRTDGSPAFFFSNAVDDALMEVTHVLRGEDHLANTPRQLLLLEALSLPRPQYGHIALLVGADGAPLSKRYGSFQVRALREAGFLPRAVVNHLARLGHRYEDERLCELEELAAGFELERLGRSPARFEAGQLEHWQRLAVDAAPLGELETWLGEGVRSLVPAGLWASFTECVRPNLSRPEDGLRWAQILFEEDLRLSEPARQVIESAGSDFYLRALHALDACEGKAPAWLQELQRRAGVKGKALYLPLRAALTGELEGPDLRRLLPLMPGSALRGRLVAAASPRE